MAQSDVHEGREAKSKINTGSVGKSTPVSPSVVQEGGSMAEAKGNSLARAAGHLKKEHPIPYTSHGPHHNKNHHVRHHPVTGGVYGSPKRGG